MGIKHFKLNVNTLVNMATEMGSNAPIHTCVGWLRRITAEKMGGCCCSCRKAHLHGAPVYIYCPPVLEEQESLRSHDVTATAISAGLLVHWDLEASIPDTYRPPPPPLPYDMVFGCSRSTESDSARETISCSSFDTSATSGDLGESDCKVQERSLDISPKKLELSKSNECHVLEKEDEDVCPICLEEYETENPKFTTKCEHHYHLSCILEWMERSDSCPICDQEVISPMKKVKEE